MNFLFPVQEKIEENISEYLNSIGSILHEYRIALEYYINNDYKRFSSQIEKINTLKEQTCGLKNNVIKTMYERSLVPDSREDIYALLDLLDEIPVNMVKYITEIHLEKPEIPRSLHPEIINFYKQVQLSVQTLLSTTQTLFTDLNAVFGLVNNVVIQESRANDTEFDILRHIFGLNIELGQKNSTENPGEKYFIYC